MSTPAVYFMRHLPQERPTHHDHDNTPAWYPQAGLAPEAPRIAERIRDAHLADITFQIVMHSGFRRTLETINLVVPPAENHFSPEYHSGLRPHGIGAGDWDFLTNLKEYTAAGAYECASHILEREGHRIWSSVTQEVVPRLLPSGCAPLVSHSPLIEATIATATKRWPPKRDLGKGEIVKITFDEESNMIAFDYLPVPAAT